VDGFDSAPMLLMPWLTRPNMPATSPAPVTPKVKDLYAWIYDFNRPHDARVAEIAERVRKRYEVVIRPIDTAHMQTEIQNFLDIYAAAWKHNWGSCRPRPPNRLASRRN
jgi:hypothetical protein